MANNVGTAYVSIMPSMDGFAGKFSSQFSKAGTQAGVTFSSALSGTVGKASSGMSGAGARAGAAFTSGFAGATKKDVTSSLQAQVERAADAARAAQVGAQNASLRAQAAQARYNETVEKYGASSWQAITAEQRLNDAKYKNEKASDKAKTASDQLADAEKELAQATKLPESAFKSTTAAAEGFGSKVGSIGARITSIKGAMIGVGISIGQGLVSAVSGLTSEMADASDSAQKFASTLEFGGVDDSTIRQLTASTQEYADKTVYDLSDIRNVTAQLAANGVSDYGRLAEAAGNLNAVAGGNAETFKSVGMVMTQTAGAGKLTTENWNQLADAIPGASGRLQEALRANGAYVGNFRDAMERGEISADEFNQAVMQLGMDDAAREAATNASTIEGAMGNLEAAAVGVGSAAIDAFKPLVTGAMNGLGDWISGLRPAFDTIGEGVEAFSSHLSALGDSASWGDALYLAVTDIGQAFGLSYDQLRPWADGLKQAGDTAQGAFSVAGAAIGAFAGAISEGQSPVMALKAAFDQLPGPVQLAVGAFVAFRAAMAIGGFVTSLSLIHI